MITTPDMLLKSKQFKQIVLFAIKKFKMNKIDPEDIIQETALFILTYSTYKQEKLSESSIIVRNARWAYGSLVRKKKKEYPLSDYTRNHQDFSEVDSDDTINKFFSSATEEEKAIFSRVIVGKSFRKIASEINFNLSKVRRIVKSARECTKTQRIF